jgi:type IV pilus assembly protein PilQ
MTRLSHMLLTAALVFGAVSPARAEGPGPGEVTGVSVQPQAGRTEIAIAVHGAVNIRDFTLQSPDRLVLDVVGAQLGSNAVELYDGVKRGGVVNVRYSQFKPDIVRIVIDLDGAKAYKVTRTDSVIRLSFAADGEFPAWSSVTAQSAVPAVASTVAQEPVAPRSVPAPYRAPAAVAPSPAPRLDDPRITVTWDRASIADVVAGFAAFSGRTIILGKDIKGEVTAEIKDQPWHMAFQAILATQGLSVQEMPGGILRVDAPTALAALDSLEPLETRVVKINYGSAGSLAKTVESVLTKGRGRVVADTGTNTLILTDTRSRVSSVADFVGSLDVKTPQLSIQAKIIFVDRTDVEQLGIKYDIGNPKQFFNQVVQRPDPAHPGTVFADKNQNIVDLGGNSLAAVGNATSTVTGSALDLLYSTAIGGYTLTTFLSALEQSQLSDVQAEPVISTLDNREADILVGEETPVRVIDASSQSSTGAPRATVQFKETGIRLTVTPHVTNNRQILMQLHTERSALQLLPSTDLGYNFPKQRTDNQLLVNDGETVVIGGLTVTEVIRNRSGIPLLSGLPVVGKLFGFSNNQERRRDLVILVTPRIIDDNP